MFSAYRHPHTVDIAVGNIKNIVALVKTAVEGQVMGCFRPQGRGNNLLCSPAEYLDLRV